VLGSRKTVFKIFHWTITVTVCLNLTVVGLVSAQETSEKKITTQELLQRGITHYDPEIAEDRCAPSDSSGSVEPGKGSPTGTTFPNLDPQAMAEAINTYIEKNAPKSLMKGLGSTIVASAKNSNISPFLIVAIAQTESGIADPNYGDGVNVVRANNAFGRSATSSQPHIQGADRLWYKWSSIKASVDHTAPENTSRKDDGGDYAAYLRVVFGSELDKGDMDTFMQGYAPKGDNNDTAGYIKRNKERIKAMADLVGSEGPNIDALSNNSNSEGNGKFYVLGDSISLGSKEEITASLNKLSDAPDKKVTINASVSRSISGKGITPDNKTSGLEAIAQPADEEAISKAGVIIIALGTNSEGPASKYIENYSILVKNIGKLNQTAKIYGVNIFSSVPHKTSYNNALDENARRLGINIIDTTGQQISLSADNIHPDVAGQKLFAEAVANGISDFQSTAVIPQSESKCCAESTASTTPGRSNEEKIWNFLISEMGFTEDQAAATLGNIQQESGFSPTALNPSSKAYGIIQWYAGRKTKLLNYASSVGKPASSLDVQLQFMKIELEGPYKDLVLQPIKNSKNMAEATRIWLEKFEVPCVPGPACDPEMNKRLPFAQSWKDKFGGGQASQTVGSPSSDCDSGSTEGSGTVSGNFIWPDDGKKFIITSCFGPRNNRHHSGLDIGSPTGSRVVASDGGTVVMAEDDGAGWGKVVIIQHDNDRWTLYGHNSEILVKRGQKIDQGQLVAKSGNTGKSTGPHIHFNIQKTGDTSTKTPSNTEDPLKYLPKDGRPISPDGTNCPNTSTLR